ncbi:hypothetical protein KRX54_06225 [Actinomycetaceae bacterium TAE3-ERU4]|nr:hypothetical protein [Actinomycetaceae bacterium TAE3-ERU4]
MSIKKNTVFILASLLSCFGSVVSQNSHTPSLSSVNSFIPPVWPVVILERYEELEKYWDKGHRVVTLKCAFSSSIKASGNGKLIFHGNTPVGQSVSILHSSGFRTTYTNIEINPNLKSDSPILAGTEVGKCAKGYFLWGAKINSKEYFNPLKLIVGKPQLTPWAPAP